MLWRHLLIHDLNQYIHYCIVRKDLPLGVIAAQLVHAAGESSPGNLPPHTIAVVLSANDEKHLLEVEQKLLKNGVPHRAIREPDMGNSLTAIGIVPGSRSKLKPYFKKLQLLK